MDDWQRVARVLWEIWDPIGVRKLGAPPDEYDSYTDGVLDLLRSGADEAALVMHLLSIERDQMGMPGGRTTRQAACALLALGLVPSAPPGTLLH